MISGPKSVNEIVDILNKIVFASATVAIAAAAYSLNRSVDSGNKRNQIYTFLKDAPAEAATPEQLNKIGFLSRVCGSYLKEVTDEGATQLCQALPKVNLNTVKEISAASAPVAETVAKGGDPLAYLNSPQAIAQNSLVSGSDTTVTTVDQQWYAVIATVPVSQPDAARALAGKLQPLIPAAVLNGRSVQIFRTQISNSFAITVGGPMSKADATALASKLRNIRGFSDAFAQPDRAWSAANI